VLIVWFILGLIFCAPPSLVVSGLLYSGFGLEPPVVWLIMTLLAAARIGLIYRYSNWSLDRKESWLGVLTGTIVGNVFLWCYIGVP